MTYVIHILSHNCIGIFYQTVPVLMNKIFIFKNIHYFQRERNGGRERQRETSMYERKIHQLPLAHPNLGTWPTTQVCALAGNQTGDLSVCGMMANPLNHTSQSSEQNFYLFNFSLTILSKALHFSSLQNYQIIKSFHYYLIFVILNFSSLQN